VVPSDHREAGARGANACWEPNPKRSTDRGGQCRRTRAHWPADGATSSPAPRAAPDRGLRAARPLAAPMVGTRGGAGAVQGRCCPSHTPLLLGIPHARPRSRFGGVVTSSACLGVPPRPAPPRRALCWVVWSFPPSNGRGRGASPAVLMWGVAAVWASCQACSWAVALATCAGHPPHRMLWATPHACAPPHLVPKLKVATGAARLPVLPLWGVPSGTAWLCGHLHAPAAPPGEARARAHAGRAGVGP
jgi:hypothetical protein